MRIRITAENRNISLILPTNLIFSKGSAWICQHIGMKYTISSAAEDEGAIFHIPDHALDALFTELRRIKKRYGQWELVDVESADGNRVRIIL